MDTVFDEVMDWAKNRGFFFPSHEIYGGVAGLYDYGAAGTTLKKRITDHIILNYEMVMNCISMDGATLTPEAVLKASGHVAEFADVMCSCEKCKTDYRGDVLLESNGCIIAGLDKDSIKKELMTGRYLCKCGGKLGSIRDFNLMFKVEIGPKSGKVGYLRPETAQSIFVNFPLLFRQNGSKLPFGVVQVGKGFRNEIAPRSGLIRQREFNMLEVEMFVNPNDKSHPLYERIKGLNFNLASKQLQRTDNVDMPFEQVTMESAVESGMVSSKMMAVLIYEMAANLQRIGVDTRRLRFRQHMDDEMAHYATDCWDAEAFLDGIGWLEIAGIADRGSYDLECHSKASGKDLSVMVQTGEIAGKVLPHVLEPSHGIDRILFTVIAHNFTKTSAGIVVDLPVRMAPFPLALLPESSGEKTKWTTDDLDLRFRTAGIKAMVEKNGKLEKRMAKMREMGTKVFISITEEDATDGNVVLSDGTDSLLIPLVAAVPIVQSLINGASLAKWVEDVKALHEQREAQ